MIRPYVPGFQAAMRETNGLNGVGSPIANGNSFWVYGIAGANYTPAGPPQSPFDAPYGVEGTIVPEPGTAIAFVVGYFAMLRRRARP